ncbi:PDZ domain-containing protein 8 [Phlebotomus argentipes]|uniref:PDZ domain-containing protein 8 n=1 Tax=Phlebotomus argentipes TaxID=94469 RepID=UPI0028935EE8|nr:PDZ domain-containing protein 8 [Phlebotomus argentipes]
MDVVDILLFCFISCVIGAVLMLLGQYYVFVRFIETPDETEEKTSVTQKFELPDSVLSSIKSSESESKNPIVAINLVLQFLFYELRHSNRVRKWFYRKLSLELDELLTKSTTGRLFDKLTIRELELGGQFPDIKSLRVNNVELHDTEGYIENLDVMLDLSYRGNFRLSIDADMVLGKKGFLSVRVKHVSGLARLQFTRKPYTHWSLSFVGEPQVDLGIESQFQGRQMQSNVTSFISNQIRKAIRSKHTLPSYKLRYKPFFQKVDDELDLTDLIPEGTLSVNVCELSRLNVSSQITAVFCTITLASIPWVEARQQDENAIIFSLDLEIHKAKNQQVGIVFKQTENAVMIESIIPNTPAAKANLKKNDILIAIEGRKVTQLTHVTKIMKSIHRPMFVLRIERTTRGVIKNDAVAEDFELIESIDDGNISFSKASDSVQIGTKITRMNSLERNSSDSSVSTTPTTTPRKSSSSGKPLLRSKSRSVSVENEPKSPKRLSNDAIPETFPQQTTVDCPLNSFMRMEQVCTFSLKENLTTINLNVFGKSKDETVFLGYHNISIPSILSECSESTLGHYIKRFNLLAPEAPNLINHPLSTQSGFESRLCYGDVLISFAWSDFGGLTAATIQSPDATRRAKYSGNRSGSTDKLEDDRNESQKQHNFIRTHFNRATQCDFCGKKIWLKDAAQCKDCSMCCHKKCITKCQNSTVCGPTDAQMPTASPQQTVQPEFRVTQPCEEVTEGEDVEEINRLKNEGHRQSFSDLLTQGLKRVNSANNLAIPAIVSSLGQGSRSLPPSPQYTPRKQSLVPQTTNLLALAVQRLEMASLADVAGQQMSLMIDGIVEPFSGTSLDEIMTLAKNSSHQLYSELEPAKRVEKINEVLAKLRLALDSETTTHADLSMALAELKTAKATKSSDANLSPKASADARKAAARDKDTEAEMARIAFLLGQSEERVQALSVIMLHLCSALQHAQGIAGQ